MSVSSLGYIGFKVRDPAAWTQYASDVLGLMAVESPSGVRRFRTDANAWRISVEEGAEDDLAFVGFEVAGSKQLQEVRERLAAAGVVVGNGDPELLRERGVLGLVTCQDPEGLKVEVYYGASELHEEPFLSPVGVSRFVTGDQGIGHVVLTNKDISAARTFYSDILGFSLSDIIRMQLAPDFAIELEFYHCNPRHHTLALAPVPAPKRLHHFMLQVGELDDVGFALDRANAQSSLAQSLGKHTNDHMVSFYAQTPAGFLVEYGWGAREVDDAKWHVARHDKPSVWGHKQVKRAQ